MKIALVHDYLNQEGGAERVVEAMCKAFPGAPLYTSVYDRGAMGPFWRDIDIRTSFMQRLGPSVRRVQTLLPLLPLAFESFDLRGYDVVLSSSSTFAKGVITGPETRHICYCHSPARYAWLYHEYTERMGLGPIGRAVLPAVVSPLRVWDYAAAARVDTFIANSAATARRIAKFYRRDAEVLHPPIDLSSFGPRDTYEDYYLVLARLTSYKRIDLAVEACTRLGLPLIVAGDGPDLARLRRLAGPTIRFVGRVGDDERRRLMASCQALISPGEEDLGLTPLEVLASGRPVIAYAAGGATETLEDGVTGALFSEQSVEALMGVLQPFDGDGYKQSALRGYAERWDVDGFVGRLRLVVR